MRVNEGMIDQLIRVLAGGAILACAFVGPRTPLGYVGLIPLLTGIFGYCPLYSLLGLNTCGAKTS